MPIERPTAINPAIDLEMAVTFLSNFPGKHIYQTFAEKKTHPKKEEKALRKATVAAISSGDFSVLKRKLINANVQEQVICFMVNEGDGNGRDKSSIKVIRALFADFDGTPLDRREAFPLEAHLVVETSPGKYHLYWLVTPDFPVEKFKPAQEALALLFDSDPSTAYPTKVMRLPGFLHQKGLPFLSRLIEDNNLPHYSPEELLRALGLNQQPVPTRGKVIPIRPVPAEATPDYPQADFGVIMNACAFARHAVADAATLPEPEWYALLTVLACCLNGDKIAQIYSAAYPGYSPEETDRKYQHAKENGHPQNCSTIEQLTGGAYCQGCKHYGKITNPITLGYASRQTDVHPEIARLNRLHAVVSLGGKVAVMWEKPGHDGREVLEFMTFEDFRNYYRNQAITVGTKTGPLGSLWLDSPHRRQYEGVTFAPGVVVPENWYNFFRGFAFDPQPGDCSLYLGHVCNVIASGDERIYRYFLAWFARLFKDPGGDRPGVSIVLQGDQGSGKGAVIRALGEIVGDYYLHIASPGLLTGRFNSHLMRTLLLFVDEGYWAGSRDGEGQLKSLITEPSIAIEMKGKDAFSSPNHINLVFASNNKWVVPAGLEERRFLVLKVSSARRQDHAYFAAIRKQMDNGGREALLHYLLTEDFSDVDLRKPPRTTALAEQIIISFDSVERFWYESLSAGHLPDCRDGAILGDAGFQPILDWDDMVLSGDLHARYLGFCRQQHLRRPDPVSTFFKRLKDLCPGMRKFRLSTGVRATGYRLPPLEECREEFSRQINIPMTWPEEGEGHATP